MLVVCIRMYPYVPYVTRMLLVCYSYVTRMYSCGVLVMILHKTNFLKRSFSYRGANAWNQQSNQIREIRDLASFKRAIS